MKIKNIINSMLVLGVGFLCLFLMLYWASPQDSKESVLKQPTTKVKENYSPLRDKSPSPIYRYTLVETGHDFEGSFNAGNHPMKTREECEREKRENEAASRGGLVRTYNCRPRRSSDP